MSANNIRSDLCKYCPAVYYRWDTNLKLKLLSVYAMKSDKIDIYLFKLVPTINHVLQSYNMYCSYNTRHTCKLNGLYPSIQMSIIKCDEYSLL